MKTMKIDGDSERNAVTTVGGVSHANKQDDTESVNHPSSMTLMPPLEHNAKTLEENLMNRVKEALRRLLDHQNREQKHNREAYLNLDKQIKNLNISLGAYASDGGHLMDENSFLRKKRLNRAGGNYSNAQDIFGV